MSDDDDREDDDRFSRIVDPDVDLGDPVQAAADREPLDRAAVAVIAIGGVIGAEARNLVATVLPHTSSAFPWATVLINLTGCALLGVLMVIVLEVRTPHRLVRPFLGVGVLGGYTTFSSFAVDVQNLVDAHRAAVGLGYWSLTLGGGWLVTWALITATRRLTVRSEVAT